MDLKFVSLNINGLNDHLKRTALVDWLKCMKVDVVCLQETHSPSHESARRWFANSGYRVASSSSTSKSAGVAILVKDTYKIKKIIKDEDGRYVQAVVDVGDGQASFISLYAPNRNPARNTFFASLTGLIDLSRPTFVAGDFNSVLDPAKDRMRDPSGWACCPATGKHPCIGVPHVVLANVPAVAPAPSWAHGILLDARGRYPCVANRHGVGSNCTI